MYLEKHGETRPWFDFNRSIASFLSGDRDGFDRHRTDLGEHADVFDEKQATRYRGLATALRGIDEANEATIADGIADTIPLQEAEEDIGSPNANALVCMPAAAMYVLALMHGLDPDIDREYVPEALDDAYVGVRY